MQILNQSWQRPAPLILLVGFMSLRRFAAVLWHLLPLLRFFSPSFPTLLTVGSVGLLLPLVLDNFLGVETSFQAKLFRVLSAGLSVALFSFWSIRLTVKSVSLCSQAFCSCGRGDGVGLWCDDSWSCCRYGRFRWRVTSILECCHSGWPSDGLWALFWVSPCFSQL